MSLLYGYHDRDRRLDECRQRDRCQKCGRKRDPWPLGRHFGCSPKYWIKCIRNERKEKRA